MYVNLIGKIKGFSIVTTIALFTLLVSPLTVLNVAAAGNATLSINPGVATYTVGETFTVKIYENSGPEQVMGVTADISYDKASLEFVSLDGNQSAFTTAMPSSAGNGVVKISRAIMGSSLTGNQLVASVTFKAVGSTNKSMVNFMSSSAIAASGGRDLWNGNAAGASFTIKAPATSGGGSTSPPPSGGGSLSSSGGGSSAGSSGGAVSSPPSSGSGSSGSSAGTGGSNPGAGSSSSGSSSAAPSAPAQTATPGATDATEILAPSTFFVAVQILDEEGKAIPGATVTLDNGQKVKTDSKGIASFVNVTSGEHTVKVEHDGKERSEKIAVQQTGNEATMPQQFKLKLSKSDQVAKPYWIVYAALAVIVLGTAGVLFPRRPHFATQGLDDITEAQKIVVGGDVNVPPAPPVNHRVHQPGTVIQPTNSPPEQPTLQEEPNDKQKPQG